MAGCRGLQPAGPAGVAAHAVALAVFLLYVTGVYWVFQSEPRYSIPFRSLELLAVVAALMAASGWLQARRRDTAR